MAAASTKPATSRSSTRCSRLRPSQRRGGRAPRLLVGPLALAAIRMARARGAVVAGASAGGMALAEWSWTPAGGVRGLGFVGGLAVVPHYDDIRRTSWQRALDQLAPGGIGYLG